MLVYSLRQGEDSGYETLVRSYGLQVMAIAQRYLRSEMDAADCFQNTFVAVFQSIESFQRRSSFHRWVRRVAVNQCFIKLRERKRQPEESIEHMLPIFDDRGGRVKTTSSYEKTGVGELPDTEKMRTVIRESIDKLPEKYRLVLLLCDIDDFSMSAAAAILGISPGTAKTRLHRARSALRYIIEPLLE